MFELFSGVLAETSRLAADSKNPMVSPGIFWQQIVSIGLREALGLVAFGFVCVFYGWRIYRGLVVICAAFIGMIVGISVGAKLGSEMWGGAVGLIVLAIVAFPLTKVGVAILGACAGGIITGGIWYALRLPYEYIWAGALVGFVAGGMVSFIVFRISIMLFTSLAGTAMVIFGLLAVFNLYQPTSQTIHNMVIEYQWFVPLVLILPALGCLFLQNKLIQNGSSFSLEGN